MISTIGFGGPSSCEDDADYLKSQIEGLLKLVLNSDELGWPPKLSPTHALIHLEEGERILASQEIVKSRRQTTMNTSLASKRDYGRSLNSASGIAGGSQDRGRRSLCGGDGAYAGQCTSNLHNVGIQFTVVLIKVSKK